MNNKVCSLDWFWIIIFIIIIASVVRNPIYPKYIYNSKCICNRNAYDCNDFKSHIEAQYCFKKCGGLTNDIHYLDSDQDGLACEWLD